MIFSAAFVFGRPIEAQDALVAGVNPTAQDSQTSLLGEQRLPLTSPP